MSDGFLGRWSRRKLDARDGRPLPEPAPPPPAGPDAAAPIDPGQAVVQRADPGAGDPPAPPAPTLEDTQALTKDSDFRPFVSRAVAPEVRNAAMKKLFADPHFNVMDMLDTYVDDYSKPDPMPLSMVRQLAGARVLGLVPDEPDHPDGPVARDVADDPPAQSVAQSPSDPTDAPAPIADAHSDLRLQQDHAPGPQGPGRGPQ